MSYTSLTSDSTPLTPKQLLLKRKAALWKERSGWEPRWRGVSDYLLPFAGRFMVTDRNKGGKTFNNILDSSATRALRILAAGMMSGMTSPARPWFRLATPDADLMENESVMLWLADVAQLMRDVFHRGNTYRALHTLYEELGAFNTAVNVIEPDFENVIWNQPLTVGEYALATDHRGKVTTLMRNYELTVEQLVMEFVANARPDGSPDWSRVSPKIKNMWDSHNYDQGIEVLHLVEPRALRDRELKGYARELPRNMAFKSCYAEAAGESDKLLREGGFKDFPALCPRWHTRGGDVYGVGPGMEALGDIKQLMQEQLRKAQGIDYMARPPIILPGELKGREVDSLPGGVNYFNLSGPGSKAQNLFDVRIDLNHLLEDIRDVRDRINEHFFADLFLMISQDNRATPATATEIAERHEEKLLMLGPVLERLHDEMLSPLIDITFARLLEAGALPPAPPELNGVELKVEFVSVLAQAQRAVGLGAIDRLLGTVGLLASSSQDPGVWDKIDRDEVVERYADMLAVDPQLIVADDKVALVRDSRAQQQQAAKMAEMAPGLAQAAKSGAEAGAIMREQGASANTAGGPPGSIEQFTGYRP
jgi:hypothetical protein